MKIQDIKDGELLLQHSETGLVMQWLQTLVTDLDEQQFWDYIMKMYNEGLSEQQEQSIEKTRSENVHLIPPDFKLLIDITFVEIITRNLETLAKFGYPENDIKVRAHIGGN